jgi:hypothetical protein
MAPAGTRRILGAPRRSLYEMAAGRRAFEKERPEALMFQILHAMPRPASDRGRRCHRGSSGWIESCPDKDRAGRPAPPETWREGSRRSSGASMESVRPSCRPRSRLRSALRFPTTSRAIRAGLVRGRHDGSPTPTRPASGVARDLAHVRQSTRGRAIAPEIGHELGVDAILEGSVLVGPRVRVTVSRVRTHRQTSGRSVTTTSWRTCWTQSKVAERSRRRSSSICPARSEAVRAAADVRPKRI